MKRNKTKIFPVRLNERQHKAFYETAEKRGDKCSELVRKWIDEYINGEKK